MNGRTVIAVACSAVVLTACGTNEAARKLAERTAANTGLLSQQVNSLAEHEHAIAQLRADVLATYALAVRESRANHKFDRAITEKSGARNIVQHADDLKAWITSSEAILAEGRGSEKEIAAEIMASQKPLEPKTKALAEVSKTLARLAKEEMFIDRAKFLKAYVGEVMKLVKAAQKEADESKGKASKTGENIKKAAPKADDSEER